VGESWAKVTTDARPAGRIGGVFKDSRSLKESWQAIKSQDIPALNQELRAAGLAGIER
jgi:hypothetical protein